MKLLASSLVILIGLLGMIVGHELLTHYATPGYSYYYYYTPQVTYASVLPLAYSRLSAPGSETHLYNSVATPNSFQQQIRSDYKPITYEYIY